MKKCILFSLLLCILCGVVSFAVEGVAVVAKEETIEIVDGAIDFNEALFRYDLSRYVNVRNNAAQLSYQLAENSLEQCEILITTDNIMELRPLVATRGTVKIDVFSDGQYACSLNFNVEYVNMTKWLAVRVVQILCVCLLCLIIVAILLFCRPLRGDVILTPINEKGEDIAYGISVKAPLGFFPIPWFLVTYRAQNPNTILSDAAKENGRAIWRELNFRGWFFGIENRSVCFASADVMECKNTPIDEPIHTNKVTVKSAKYIYLEREKGIKVQYCNH